MKWRRVAIFAVLQAQLPVTDAVPVLGLTDPRLCYLLDGFLFIYAVVMTALFVKAKYGLSSSLAKPLNHSCNQARMTCIINCLVDTEMNMMFWGQSEVQTPSWVGDTSREERTLRRLSTLHCRRTRWVRHTVKSERRESRGGEAKGMKVSTRDSVQRPRTLTMLSKCSLCPPAKWESQMGWARVRGAHLLWGGEERKPCSSKTNAVYFLSAKTYFGW